MRAFLVAMLLVFACNGERVTRPPQTADRAAELRATHPGEYRPEKWMFGCYSTNQIVRGATPPPELIQLTDGVINPDAPLGLRKYGVLGRYRRPVRGEWWLESATHAHIGIGVPYQGPWWGLNVELSPEGGTGSVKYMTDADVSQQPVGVMLKKIPCS